MADKTMNLINRLAEDRIRLYSRASNGHRGDPRVRDGIAIINRELEALWETHRQAKAGRREGIDLLLHNAYERSYGSDYEDAYRPPAVADESDVVRASAA